MREYIERTVVIDLLERYGATDDAIALINTILADDNKEKYSQKKNLCWILLLIGMA